MRHYKLATPLVLSVLCVSCAQFSTRPAIAWRVVDVRPHEIWAVDGRTMDYDCWRVDFDVTNTTRKEMLFDWNREEIFFLVDGRWEKLGFIWGRAYLGPNASWQLALRVPQQAQACRCVMYYKRGSAATYYRQFTMEAKIQ